MSYPIDQFKYRNQEIEIFLEPDRTYSVKVGQEISSHYGTIPYARRAGEAMIDADLKITTRRRAKWLKSYAK